MEVGRVERGFQNIKTFQKLNFADPCNYMCLQFRFKDGDQSLTCCRRLVNVAMTCLVFFSKFYFDKHFKMNYGIYSYCYFYRQGRQNSGVGGVSRPPWEFVCEIKGVSGPPKERNFTVTLPKNNFVAKLLVVKLMLYYYLFVLTKPKNIAQREMNNVVDHFKNDLSVNKLQ